MPLADDINKVMRLLEQQAHPDGKILLERDKPRRRAEREGTFAQIFQAMNPDT